MGRQAALVNKRQHTAVPRTQKIRPLFPLCYESDMKTVILGDIHGRTVWRDILEKENPDRIIFLGDYVSTHEGIRPKQQITNLREIMERKEDESERFILLRGNHDMQHLGYHWAECSGPVYEVMRFMGDPEFRERFLEWTQWVYEMKTEDRTILFSHAGVSQVWMDNNGIQDVGDINALEPSERFSFTPDTPWDGDGDSVTQPCTWIRPDALLKAAIPGYTQVVGHTPLKVDLPTELKTGKTQDAIWLCDTLHVPSYLILEDGIFRPEKLDGSAKNS